MTGNDQGRTLHGMEGGHVHVGVLFGVAVIAWVTATGFVIRWAGTRWPENPAVQGLIALW